MYSLIFKDLLLSKKIIPFAAIYGFFMILLFEDNMDLGNTAFISGIVAVSYMLSIRALAYEDINKSEIMLLSLPVSRNKVVLAKYLSVIVYGLIGVLSYLIGVSIIYILNLPINVVAITFESIIGAIFALGIMFSVTFPLFFKYGYVKSKFFAMFIFLAVFFGVSNLINLFNIGKLDSINVIIAYVSTLSDRAIWIILLIITFLIVTISYNVSVKIYKSREF